MRLRHSPGRLQDERLPRGRGHGAQPPRRLGHRPLPPRGESVVRKRLRARGPLLRECAHSSIKASCPCPARHAPLGPRRRRARCSPRRRPAPPREWHERRAGRDGCGGQRRARAPGARVVQPLGRGGGAGPCPQRGRAPRGPRGDHRHLCQLAPCLPRGRGRGRSRWRPLRRRGRHNYWWRRWGRCLLAAPCLPAFPLPILGWRKRDCRHRRRFLQQAVGLAPV
mmetsp:Transcript_19482/g.52440  ORF Transcript_19482/g.52440 Transcript_19482/m.52440 type:complete len:224 (-) Transcript_19482:1266-1937(-)